MLQALQWCLSCWKFQKGLREPGALTAEKKFEKEWLRDNRLSPGLMMCRLTCIRVVASRLVYAWDRVVSSQVIPGCNTVKWRFQYVPVTIVFLCAAMHAGKKSRIRVYYLSWLKNKVIRGEEVRSLGSHAALMTENLASLLYCIRYRLHKVNSLTAAVLRHGQCRSKWKPFTHFFEAWTLSNTYRFALLHITLKVYSGCTALKDGGRSTLFSSCWLHFACFCFLVLNLC